MRQLGTGTLNIPERYGRALMGETAPAPTIGLPLISGLS